MTAPDDPGTSAPPTDPDHPSAEELRGFLRGELEYAGGSVVVRHLLGGCRRCAAEVRRFHQGGRRPADLPVHPSSYGGIWRRVLEGSVARGEAIARDRDAGARLFRQVEATPPGERLALVAREKRFSGLGLAELLADDAARPAAPEVAAELAETALAVVPRADPELFGESAVDEVAARAWCRLAEARRRGGDRAAAGRALAVAREVAADVAVPAPLLSAELATVAATIARDAGHRDEVRAAIRRALALHRRAGEAEIAGDTLLRLASLACETGSERDRERTVSLLERGLADLDRERHPRLAAALALELVGLLLALGRPGEALLRLQRAEPLVEAAPEELAHRRTRLHAAVAAALGRRLEADGILEALAERLTRRAREAGVDRREGAGAADAAVVATLERAALGGSGEGERAPLAGAPGGEPEGNPAAASGAGNGGAETSVRGAAGSGGAAETGDREAAGSGDAGESGRRAGDAIVTESGDRPRDRAAAERERLRRLARETRPLLATPGLSVDAALALFVFQSRAEAGAPATRLARALGPWLERVSQPGAR